MHPLDCRFYHGETAIPEVVEPVSTRVMLEAGSSNLPAPMGIPAAERLTECPLGVQTTYQGLIAALFAAVASCCTHQTSRKGRGQEMKRSLPTLVAVLALVWAASPLVAASGAGKTMIEIDAVSTGASDCLYGTFTLAFHLRSLPADDRGTVECHRTFGPSGRTPQGLAFETVRGTNTFKGKAGSLVMRFRGRSFPVPRVGQMNEEVWTGTWSLVRGTGKYAGSKGGGAYAAVGEIHTERLAATYTGFFARS